MKTYLLYWFLSMSVFSCTAQQMKIIEEKIIKDKPIWIESWINNPLLDLKSDGWHSFDSEYSYKYTKVPEYELFYSYSPSKKLFVDVYSRTIDIDTNDNDISLVYLEAESEIILSNTIEATSERLLFVSDGTFFEDVIWISDSCFVVLGNFIDFSSNEISPEITIFNLKKQKKAHYKGIINKRRFDYIERKF